MWNGHTCAMVQYRQQMYLISLYSSRTDKPTHTRTHTSACDKRNTEQDFGLRGIIYIIQPEIISTSLTHYQTSKL